MLKGSDRISKLMRERVKSRRQHIVQFYDNESYLYKTVSRFIYKGLEEGDGVIVVATAIHIQGIEQCLAEQGIEVERAKSQEQLIFLDAHQAIGEMIVNDVPNQIGFNHIIEKKFECTRAQFSGVRIYGEMVSLLCSQNKIICALILEGYWNEFINRTDAKLLCAYPMNIFYSPVDCRLFDQICEVHSHVIPTEKFSSNADEETQSREVAALQQRSEALQFERKKEKGQLLLIEREKETRIEAERANRAKDEFLAIVSHELRTPLQPIFSWIDLIRRGNLKPEQMARGLHVIERSAKAQAQIINDLLDISRVISGKMVLDVQRVDLASMASTALELCRPDADLAGIKIFSKIDSGLFVWGDSSRLQQILWNILSNSIKYSPRGSQVEVRIERKGSSAELLVRDNGRGIAPSFLPFIFDRFRQEDSSRTRPKGGLGLGLSIVRSLIEQHGGSIRAESEGEGRGSTFKVLLPMVRASSDFARMHLSPIKKKSNLKVLPSLEGVKVLLVDDEEDTREAVGALLTECHAIVRTAASASEALRIIKNEIPDILLTDLGMPGEDGYFLIRTLRALDPSEGSLIPAVALTAFAGSIEENQVIKAGFQSFVDKPVDAFTLVQLIQNLVEHFQDTEIKAA